MLSSLPTERAAAMVNRITAEQCACMVERGVISADSPVGCDRLRRVSFPFVDFDGRTQTGVVVVLDAVAPHVGAIFNTLYGLKFPLARAVPIEHYHGDDTLSMNDNNTSAFNSRPITGGSDWSLHAYGVAIDINPGQNPYISFGDNGQAFVRPPSAAMLFSNRLMQRPRKPMRSGMAECVVDVFANNGFLGWGGYWDFPIDYQHFEIGPRDFVKRLVAASPEEASHLFDCYVAEYAACMARTRETDHDTARAQCIAEVWK